MVRLVSEGDIIKSLVGNQWGKLHPDIQRRFNQNPQLDKPYDFSGTMSEISCSIWGKILGFLTMPIIKGALLPYTAKNVPVDIQVSIDRDSNYVYKKRTYKIKGRKSIEFTSHMGLKNEGVALEYVGAGFGMKLIAYVREQNLRFESTGYFWDIGLCKIPIPEILSPGKTYLYHDYIEDGTFQITIDMRHKYLGKMYTQKGIFNDL